MLTYSQDFEQVQETKYNHKVLQFLQKKSFVLNVKPIVGDHYQLSLGVDKDATAIFISYLNVIGYVMGYDYYEGEPVASLSLYIPEKGFSKSLSGMEKAFRRLSDYMAYKSFKSDFKHQLPTYHLADWLTGNYKHELLR